MCKGASPLPFLPPPLLPVPSPFVPPALGKRGSGGLRVSGRAALFVEACLQLLVVRLQLPVVRLQPRECLLKRAGAPQPSHRRSGWSRPSPRCFTA